jgi:hypothetical protein
MIIPFATVRTELWNIGRDRSIPAPEESSDIASTPCNLRGELKPLARFVHDHLIQEAVNVLERGILTDERQVPSLVPMLFTIKDLPTANQPIEQLAQWVHVSDRSDLFCAAVFKLGRHKEAGANGLFREGMPLAVLDVTDTEIRHYGRALRLTQEDIGRF